MSGDAPYDPRAFREFEHKGWDTASANYHGTFAHLTRLMVGRLLDAVEPLEGARLLDVACGTGNAASAATVRGARVVGLDFVAAMVTGAQRLHPETEFRLGDAEEMPFAAGEFEAVVCNFGLRHFPHPERALLEAFRVLAPGGRFAFTDWRPPGPFHTIVRDAVDAHGAPEAEPPPAGPPYELSDPPVSRKMLAAAGFVETGIEEITIVGKWANVDRVMEGVYGGVRTRGALERHGEQARKKIDAAIAENALRFEKGGAIEIPAKALLASARKP